MTQDILTKYIELNTFLRIIGVEGTGGKIKIIIRSGFINVNGEAETRNKRRLHAGDVVEYLGKIGARLLIQILPEYLAGSLKPKTQNHSQATFSKRIKKSNGYIDLNNPPDSKTFDRMIRAFYPWPGVYTKLKIKNEKLKIIKFLPGNLIQPEGKRPMTTKEFLNGYPETKKFIGELLNGDNST